MISLQFIRGIEVTPLPETLDKGEFSLGVIDLNRKSLIAVEENFNKKVKFNFQYYMDLQFVLVNKKTNEQHHFDTGNYKSVMIEVASKALGDQIAWLPYIDLFQKKHNCKVRLNIKLYELFQPFYPNIEMGWTEDIVEADAFFVVGYDVTGKDTKISPVDCRTVPLQHVAAYQLGLEPKEVKTVIKSNITEPIIKDKYVVICTCGTAAFKVWNNKRGFPELIKYFKSKGYKVIDVGETSDNLEGTESYNGVLEWNKLMNIIENAQMFVSGSNGLAWLAWACGQKNIVTVNNITARGTEFEHFKVDNKDVCNSCWNDTQFIYDNKDVNYCPRKQDFICSKSIESKDVIEVMESNNLI